MRRVALLLGVVAVVLVLAEVGARALAPYLPEPDLYTDATTTVKVAQLDERDCVDVVFAGNSMTRDGLLPERFTAADPQGRRAYNAALDAATPALLERWVLDEVDPRVHPDGVVIGLSSFDLNDNAAIGRTALSAYDEAPLTRDDLFGRLQAPFIRSLALFEHRNALRDPEALWGALGDLAAGEEAPRLGPAGIDGVLGAQGQGLSRQDLRYEPSPLTERFAQDQLLNDFELGGRQSAALRTMVRELTERGVDVAVVALPVTEDYVDAHPGGSATHDEFLSLAEEIADDGGATFVDLHDAGRGDGAFADTHHLNRRGAEALSASLPDLLGPDFASGDRC